MKLRALLVRVKILGFLWTAQSYTIHAGSCPILEPKPNFNIAKFLGRWYVMQMTPIERDCLTYYLAQSEELGVYNWEEVSEHNALEEYHFDRKIHLRGHLIQNENNPAWIYQYFPLAYTGNASCTVLMTDYDHYAGIFMCKNIWSFSRQSIRILSRNRTLNRNFLRKIHSRLRELNLTLSDLAVVKQITCLEEYPAFNNTIFIDGSWMKNLVPYNMTCILSKIISYFVNLMLQC